jgi:hypothetical protein
MINHRIMLGSARRKRRVVGAAVMSSAAVMDGGAARAVIVFAPSPLRGEGYPEAPTSSKG